MFRKSVVTYISKLSYKKREEKRRRRGGRRRRRRGIMMRRMVMIRIIFPLKSQMMTVQHIRNHEDQCAVDSNVMIFLGKLLFKLLHFS